MRNPEPAECGTGRAETGALAPRGADVITASRVQIDQLDEQIITLIERRRALSADIQRTRIAAGGTKFSYGRENEVISRYHRRLGKAGVSLGMTILELCRGPLGKAATASGQACR